MELLAAKIKRKMRGKRAPIQVVACPLNASDGPTA